MSTITIEVLDIEGVKQAFKTAPDRLKAALGEALNFSAILTQRIEKEEAPVDTGYLRGSIDTRVNTDSAVIWPRANYALPVVQGTGLFGPNRARIYPKNGKVLAWKAPGGQMRFARSIAGQKPNDFVGRTKARAEPQVFAAFDSAVDNIIKGK